MPKCYHGSWSLFHLQTQPNMPLQPMAKCHVPSLVRSIYLLTIPGGRGSFALSFSALLRRCDQVPSQNAMAVGQLHFVAYPSTLCLAVHNHIWGLPRQS